MGLERSVCGFLCFNWAGRWALLIAQLVKNPPAVQETPVRFLGREDPLEKGEATHSSTLAWRIPMDRGACRATVPGVKKSWTGVRTAQQGRQVNRAWSATLWSDCLMTCCVLGNTFLIHPRLKNHPWRVLSLLKTSLKRGGDVSRQVCVVTLVLIYCATQCLRHPEMLQLESKTKVKNFEVLSLPCPHASSHCPGAGYWVPWASISIVKCRLTPVWAQACRIPRN